MRLLLQNRFTFFLALAAGGVFLLGTAYLGAAELPNFADLVEENAPSIVEISTIRSVESRSPVADQELEDILKNAQNEE